MYVNNGKNYFLYRIVVTKLAMLSCVIAVPGTVQKISDHMLSVLSERNAAKIFQLPQNPTFPK